MLWAAIIAIVAVAAASAAFLVVRHGRRIARANALHGQALAELSALYESFIRLHSEAQVAYAVVGDGRFTDANPFLCQLLGRTVEELVALPDFSEVVVPEMRLAVAQRMRDRLEGRAVPARFEAALLHKDGRRLEMDLAVDMVEHGGRRLGLLMGRDITARKRAVHELNRKEAEWRLLFEGNPNPMLVYGTSSLKLLAVNEAALALYGYPRGEMLSMTMRDLRSMEDLPKLMETLGALAEGGALNRTGRVRHRRKDGTPIEVEVSSGPVTFEGMPARLVVVTDLTQRRAAEEALHSQTQLYQCLLGAQSDLGEGFVLVEDWRMVMANEAAHRITGRGDDALRALKSPVDMVAPDRRDEATRRLNSRMAGGSEPEHYETTLARPDGTRVEVDLSVKVLAQDPPRVLYLFRDITERKRAQQALLESEERYRGLLSAAFDGLAVHREGRIVTVNPPFARAFGYAEEEMADIDVLGLIDPADRERVRVRLLSREESPFEAMGLRHDGSTFPLEVCSRPCLHHGLPARVTAVRDISYRKRAEEALRHQSLHDPLTGLPNRMLFQDQLGLELAQAQRAQNSLAVLVMDLDRFKKINDTLGHTRGDATIRAVAGRLEAALEEGETLARLGGDEFIVLLPSVREAADAAKAAERLLQAFALPFDLEGQEAHLTVSMGIALYPTDGADAVSLLRNADAALARAKEHGRNNFQMYTTAMNARAFERLTLENSLRHALVRQEFLVYYQPQVSLKDGHVAGLEALIRWQHPELGLVFPDSFIPMAEDTGLIVPMGEWLMADVARQMAAWEAEGIKVPPVAINLSARQFRDLGFADSVERALKQAKLDPALLELEVTETLAMQDVRHTLQVLSGLKALGLRVALDDFGTGYSSLAYLKQFPIDTLKIDRSFVRELPNDASDSAIVKTILVLARNLGLRVVAEGVENRDQLQFLADLECDWFQGYLFSRPVPASEIRDMLKSGRRQEMARAGAPARRPSAGSGPAA